MRPRLLRFALGATATLCFARGCGSASPSDDSPAAPLPPRADAGQADAAGRDGAKAPACGTIDTRVLRSDTGSLYRVRYFAANGDDDAAPSGSSVILYEDGRPLGPAHASEADIRSLGSGRYRHWRTTLSFSASDSTDPRANGRTYTWSVPGGACPRSICGRVDVASAIPETGSNHIVEQSFGFRGDTLASPTQSGLVVYEDGRELGPAHSLHAEIRALGQGRFSHWGNSLYFSSSDGSSPKTNGRDYVYGGPCRPLAQVALTELSAAVPLYATFQSNDQKVIENAHGIFLTYLDHASPSGLPEAYGDLHLWKLLRSADQGKTFATVYEESKVGKAPAVETDEDGDVYLIVSDLAPADTSPTGGDALFFHFSAATNFAPPRPARIAGGAAGKFASVYDPTRQSLYYFTYDGGGDDLYTLDKAGNVVAKLQLVKNGPVGLLQYPHLAMRGSTLFAAWTTQKVGVYLYWDIHVAKSEDGGRSWQKLDGTPLALPIVADDSGPADGIVPADELGSHNWLSSFYPKGDAVHFMYLSQTSPPREHHVRWDMTSHAIGRNHTPTWAGGSLALRSLDGFFASPDDGAGTLLYAVSTYNGADWPSNALVVLASDDDGVTWFDYALSRPLRSLYSIGGARRVTRGFINGTFTNQLSPDPKNLNGHEAWYFRVPAE